jgi:hypothetical protein
MVKRIISKRRRNRIEDGSRDIYGTIIVLALIVSFENYNVTPLKMLISIIGTLLVIAIAETYVNAQKKSYYEKRRLTYKELKSIIKHEFQIMLASEIPILVFLIQYFGFISIDTAFFLAKVLGLITIFSFSIIIERAMKKPWLQTIVYSLISTGIGFLIIGLKILTK